MLALGFLAISRMLCAALVGASFAGCVVEAVSPGCDASAAAGLSVAVRRVGSNIPVCDANVAARDGVYTERLMPLGPPADCRYIGAWERAGRYTVTVFHDGFTTRVLAGVTVGQGECHVIGQRLEVELSRP